MEESFHGLFNALPHFTVGAQDNVKELGEGIPSSGEIWTWDLFIQSLRVVIIKGVCNTVAMSSSDFIFVCCQLRQNVARVTLVMV